MNRQRWIVLIAILVLGSVMAWDSGVSSIPGELLTLVSLAVAIPAAAGLLSGNLRIHAAAAAISSVILLIARIRSGVEIRWYAMPWIFFSLMLMNWLYEHRRLSSGEDNGNAGPRPAI